jgi:predicted transcriptional regulator
MPAETIEELDVRTQHAVVLELLSRSHAISTSKLYSAIQAETTQIDDAVRSLADAGVLLVERDQLWATAALRRIDALGMIAV